MRKGTVPVSVLFMLFALVVRNERRHKDHRRELSVYTRIAIDLLVDFARGRAADGEEPS